MKIGVFLGINPSAGGMFQYSSSILNGLKHLDSAQIEVKIVYISKDWEKILSSLPFKNHKLRFGKLGLLVSDAIMVLRFSGKLSRILSSLFNPLSIQMKKLACDVWIFPSQDALSYQVKMPVIVAIHDLMHRYESSFPEVSSRGRNAIRDHRFSNIASRACAILVDSEVGRKQVNESYGTDLKKIFSLPYIPPDYVYKGARLNDFDLQLNLPDKFIFYPAQFWEHKNHKRLISAAALIRKKNPDIALIFTGGKTHTYYDVLKHVQLTDMSNNVFFLGYVPDERVSEIYKKARALVMPTFFGPTNIPPLEAFLCGCPVAISGTYGMPEQVGDAALLFDPQSVESIAKALDMLWNDDELCMRLIKRGYKRSAQWGIKEFTVRLAEILFEIEKNLLKG